MSLLRRLISKVAVLACDSCEGASGAILDVAAGTVHACPVCHGTGEGRRQPVASVRFISEERDRRRGGIERAA